MKQLTRALLNRFESLKPFVRWWLRPRASTPPRRRIRPCLLQLEDRCVPATITWTGAVDNDWNTAGNWMGGVKPGVSDVAEFNNNVNCDLSTTAAVGGVDLKAGFGATLTIGNGGQLTYGSQKLLYAGGTMSIATGGEVVAEGNAEITGKTLTNSGTFTWKSLAIDLANNAVFTTSGYFFDQPTTQGKFVSGNATTDFRLT